MNKWIKKSLDLSNSNYIDKLYDIYPLEVNLPRELSSDEKKLINEAYKDKNPVKLFNSLIGLKKFPIDNSFIATLRLDEKIRNNNPITIKKIGSHLLKFDIDDLISMCEEPKSPSRQIGPMFKNWLKKNYKFLNEKEFEISEKGLFFLDGSDNFLKDFVNKKFDADLRSPNFKGIDFVFKKDKKYCFGEAKFITHYGGTQTNQFNIALKIAELRINNISSVAIIDGIPWFNNSFKKKIIESDKNILSGILFNNFIKEF